MYKKVTNTQPPRSISIKMYYYLCNSIKCKLHVVHNSGPGRGGNAIYSQICVWLTLLFKKTMRRRLVCNAGRPWG